MQQIWSYQNSPLEPFAITGPANQNFKANRACANSVSGETIRKPHNAAANAGWVRRLRGYGCPVGSTERTEFDHVRFHYFQTHGACRIGNAFGLHRPTDTRSGADAQAGRSAGACRRFRATQSEPGDRRLQRRLLHLQQDRRDAGRGLLHRQGRPRRRAWRSAGKVPPTDCPATFELREGVKWHDGKPFTSADVAFSALQVWKPLQNLGRTVFKDLRPSTRRTSTPPSSDSPSRHRSS